MFFLMQFVNESKFLIHIYTQILQIVGMLRVRTILDQYALAKLYQRSNTGRKKMSLCLKRHLLTRVTSPRGIPVTASLV